MEEISHQDVVTENYVNEETVRKAFETVYLGGNKQTARRNEHGDYVLPSIQDAWSGWRAACAHLASG